MSKVCGLFLDYDGTIGPLKALRQISKLSTHIETVLFNIRTSIPVAIISMKDMQFILPRTPFASAWAAIAGLEIKIGTELFTSRGVGDVLSFLHQSLNYAKQNLREGVVIEEKRDYKGHPLAFCVDWRSVRNKKEAQEMASQIVTYCRNFPLAVIEYADQPYLDVFPYQIDKGKTVKELKEKLGLLGDIIYMGDSITDNDAFKAADISIGVTEGKKPIELYCKYWIKFEDVVRFLSGLYRNNYVFSSGLPGLNIEVDPIPWTGITPG
jgi:HAD superfamily hydrolase (TIGR01484 family)